MVDLDWKAKNKMVVSPKLSNKLNVTVPAITTTPFRYVTNVSPVPASDTACSSYEQYLRLPELKKLWTARDFPDWQSEPVLKPALQALEITFRFVSTVLSDPRPYVNQREWVRRIESIGTWQVELISLIVEDDQEFGETHGKVPVVDLKSTSGVLTRGASYAEFWKGSGSSGDHSGATVVSRTSEGSLLPRLATWRKSESVAQKIMYSIECEMRRCPYTLGLGEPNLSGKPNLDYDAVCRPSDIQSLKIHSNNVNNDENATLHTAHQMMESWIHVAEQIIERLIKRVDEQQLAGASSDAALVERIWKLLSDIVELHLLMDPDDFLRLKSQIITTRSQNKTNATTDSFCFRSRPLVELTKSCKELRHKVPEILGVEVDPKGGPRVQEAAMRLYREKGEYSRIHLLQGLQAIEASMKGFFYRYKQMLVVVVGSLEARSGSGASGDLCDSLTQLFIEPTYFPSLDAAKTFLGEFWSRHETGGCRKVQ